MGQAATQPACQDKGILWCCSPEGDEKNDAVTSTPAARNGYGSADSTTAGSTPGSQSRQSAPQDPPGRSDRGKRTSNSDIPVPTAPSTSVTFDYILSDLEGAEQVAYGEAFSTCASGKQTSPMDCVPMRQFILNNTCITADDLDPHLLQVATEETTITVDGFLHVIREGAVSDTSTIEQFLGMSQNGETVAAEECRSGLLVYSQRDLGANFAEEKWDRIFNTVMWDADVTVSMEKWIFYCKVVARIIRLSTYAKA